MYRVVPSCQSDGLASVARSGVNQPIWRSRWAERVGERTIFGDEGRPEADG
jgi:hypothetical protein